MDAILFSFSFPFLLLPMFRFFDGLYSSCMFSKPSLAWVTSGNHLLYFLAESEGDKFGWLERGALGKIRAREKGRRMLGEGRG